MRGILIDPFKRTVEEIETDGSLTEIYNLLEVQVITTVVMGYNDTLYLDDEGLFVPKEEQAYFRIKGNTQPFAGRGLILGTDYEGENDDAMTPLPDIREAVLWIDNDEVEPEDYLGFAIYPV